MITSRPATLADIPQVRDIHHWYIVNTCSTFTTTPPPVSHYEDILRDLNRRQLPFYVVVSDTRKSADGADLILGYAYLSPFRGDLLSYAPTVELSIFMRNDQRSWGYGTMLLKKLMELAGSGSLQHRCEERVGDLARIGASSIFGVMNTSAVQNVIAGMAFNPESPAEGIRLRDWFVRLGFVQKGRLESVGRKMGHWYVGLVHCQYGRTIFADRNLRIDIVYLQWTLQWPLPHIQDGN
ncbi:unnamed protein product [Penicillium salamii]|uniref:N-acetyltransferase domain-containing protein n=1 Tax=Penicillium salamii TaxID=1612424 RepID=A0A9W4ISM5_9EURO|nr:unnamed protein product [Penicillium salamii]CAG8052548.1 unnamed protein product [Penicillium salamii]CAG8329942.1 unnamed protein product [Penicillium salamii]CAG8330166.1 unnamed protein product [Penicillium salamii]CAG8338900.1 unnamed protein product [Penicillium salamii]